MHARTWHPDTIRSLGFTDTQERVTGNAADAMHHARKLARQRGLSAESVRAYRLAEAPENTWGFFIDPQPQPAAAEAALLP